ncbi:SHOCT domain-containing protein [Belnapia rosea]|uniref:Short C-terminal domain-containing protein n=1 Tax=Belnapia rosea TaxID=938405 RepID=A0A1G6LBL1_9PROT|nr:SHOCT domain-containing protein [Belnapia rosea]SDC40523.1 Short C-terminal domain-containing protein [Belnapia rosea]
MRELTEAGMRQVEEIARQQGVSREAALVLLHALADGGGAMAQFSHPELGGMGQWSRGGMIMIGDMFNNGLKARVDALCVALAGLLHGPGPVFAPAMPGRALDGQAGGGAWWPAELGSPAASGAQNSMAYAYFPAARRLAVRQDGQVRIFDTDDHRISGVSQQQGGGQVLAFTGDRGEVRLEALREVGGEAPSPVAAAVPESGGEAPESGVASLSTPGGSPIELIRQLAELHRQGVLTEAEFQAKKTELLGRL